jgi:hypothetical protein
MERASEGELRGSNRCDEVDEHFSHAHLGAEDGGAPARGGR